MSDDVDDLPPRPRIRGECERGERPCPYVTCAHHLYPEVARKFGAINHLHETIEPWELQETCALDIADRGGASLEEVAAAMNLTKERIRQIEALALRRMQAAASRAMSDELPPLPRPTPTPVRRLPVLVTAPRVVPPVPAATPTPAPSTPPKSAPERIAGRPAGASRRRAAREPQRALTPAEVEAAGDGLRGSAGAARRTRKRGAAMRPLPEPWAHGGEAGAARGMAHAEADRWRRGTGGVEGAARVSYGPGEKPQVVTVLGRRR